MRALRAHHNIAFGLPAKWEGERDRVREREREREIERESESESESKRERARARQSERERQRERKGEYCAHKVLQSFTKAKSKELLHIQRVCCKIATDLLKYTNY